MANAEIVQRIVESATEAYRMAPASIRAAVLRSGVEIVPSLDKHGASNELALAAAAAVSAGLFSMVLSAVEGDRADEAVLRAAYFQLIGRAIHVMSAAPGSLQ
jgi:hypothetical protein